MCQQSVYVFQKTERIIHRLAQPTLRWTVERSRRFRGFFWVKRRVKKPATKKVTEVPCEYLCRFRTSRTIIFARLIFPSRLGFSLLGSAIVGSFQRWTVPRSMAKRSSRRPIE